MSDRPRDPEQAGGHTPPGGPAGRAAADGGHLPAPDPAEAPAASANGADADAQEHAATGQGPPAGGDLVDWGGTGRRVRRSALVVGALVLVGWLVTGLLGDGPDLAGLAGWLGLGLGLLFVAEVVVVGGAALRGMLRAGERGERLAGGDVGLLPTLRRRDR